MSQHQYLAKYRFYPKQIQQAPKNDLGIVVVIPCYNEPNLINALKSLYACDSPKCAVEVIVVINSSENDSEEVLMQNALTELHFGLWIRDHFSEHLRFYIIKAAALPVKHAGVGLARKIGMDEAVERFETVSCDNGIIACFDADCTCDPTYLKAIENHFRNDAKTPGCSVYYEHPIAGDEFDAIIYEGIINYELFLRYYNQGLRFSGFPFAYHTVGSAMVVTSEVYQKQGGMNKRKAGEDFYFLQKVIPLGNYTELNTTKIIPSPRISSRVPFGTGKAMQKWVDTKEFFTCAPQTFSALKIFFSELPKFYSTDETTNLIADYPEALAEFLMANDFENRINEIKANSSSQPGFVKRFYQWFNAFMILKFVHFARDNYYAPCEIGAASLRLLKIIGYQYNDASISNKSLLQKYREIEKIKFRTY